VRHHLFLAVKEALNNALRHASASEIRFGIRVLPDQLEISIADNGSGFQVASQSNGNGLLNLNSRLQKLGGQCEVSSSRGAGTSVCFHLPLPVRNTTL
jgi:signal transduction histidine kinase